MIGRPLKVCTADFGHLGQDAALHPNHRHKRAPAHVLTCDAASRNPIFLFLSLAL